MTAQENWVLDNEVNRLNVDGRMTYFYDLFLGARSAPDRPGESACARGWAREHSETDLTGLGFFIKQMAALRGEPCPSSPHGAGETEVLAEPALSRRIGAAAQIWVDDLVEAELKIPASPALDPKVRRRFTLLFGRLVETEALRRLCGNGRGGRSARGRYAAAIRTLWNIRDELAALPLNETLPPFCREVLAMWNPFWRRYSFVLYSPFDILRRLEYSPEQRKIFNESFAGRVERAQSGTEWKQDLLDPSPMASAEPRPDRKLIAIEGIDGAGKTTMRYALYEALRKSGDWTFVVGQRGWLDVNDTTTIVDFRERRYPRGSNEVCGARFRDKAAHVRQSMEPALRTHHVVSDRYVVSDAVYEEALLGVAAEATLQRHRAARTRQADLVIFLDLDPEIALQRIGGRKRNRQIHENAADLRRLSDAYRRVFSDPKLNGAETLIRFGDELSGDPATVAARAIDVIRRRLEDCAPRAVNIR